jgi:cell division protein FtsI (penicillin-binding protein 3)
MTGEAKKWLKFRMATILLFFLVLYLALISRAFQLQILSGNFLRQLAEKQHTKAMEIPPERGMIFDRNGEKLAATVMADSVCADPSKIIDHAQFARKVSRIIGVDSGLLERHLSASRNFCWLARRVNPEEASRIEALDLDGVYIVKEPKRFYPSGELAGHLLGFVGLDSEGLEGLERRYEKFLKGTPQKLIWSRDAKGKWLYPRIEKAAVQEDQASHLVLTIDSRIQYVVESQLREAIRDKGAKGGFAVVMDPKTGEILALADEPAFDPNHYSFYSVGKGGNKAIGDCFDPGSTFKPFLAAGALEEGVVKERDRFNCENGSYAIGDRVIHEANHKHYSVLTFPEILKYSSNIGCVKISERLGKEKFYHYIRQFGFGSRTGIDLPGESPGLLRPSSEWTHVDTANHAFGQGISVTALQLVTALSAIANQGVLMKPFVVKGLVNKNGQVIQAYRPTVVRRVISPESARRLTAILTDVVEAEDGTGKNARIAGIHVAGKTGTSQKYDSARRVFSLERVRTSFMGFFPAENPQVVMLVILDEPQRERWGGLAAAPVFRKIGEQILDCFKTTIREMPSPDMIRPGSDMKVRLVSASHIIPQDIPRPLNQKPSLTLASNESLVPDFRSMTIREALKQAREKSIELKILGSGWAVNQDPLPGAPISDNRSCTVTFSTGR